MNTIPIYIVNLDRSPERLTYIQRQFSKRNLEFDRMPAIDGAKLPKSELDSYKNESKNSLSHYAALSNVEIGCSLSQKQSWSIAAKSRHRATVVLEDDVQISDKFSSVIQSLYENMDENIIIDLKGKRGFFEIERISLSSDIPLCTIQHHHSEHKVQFLESRLQKNYMRILKDLKPRLII